MAEMNRTLSMEVKRQISGNLGREMSSDEARAVDEKLAATQVCVKGGALVKFVLGRRRRHERFFKVEGVGETPILKWSGGKSGRIAKVESEVGKGLQREQRLSDAEMGRCFQVVLDGKVVVLMAPDVQTKKTWVVGLTAARDGLK